jgi:hypothetical protein
VEEVWGCEMQPKYKSLCLVQSTFQQSDRNRRLLNMPGCRSHLISHVKAKSGSNFHHVEAQHTRP